MRTDQLPTKYLCILVPAPFWQLICINLLHCTSGADLKIDAAPSDGAIWDEFIEQN